MVELHFSSGDYVVLRLAKRELRGHVLEHNDSSILLLKLDNGYNIGVPKEKILKARALKKLKQEIKESRAIEHKDLPNIGLVVCGGTIASKLDSKTGGVKHLVDASEFAQYYPELFNIVNVKKIEVPFMIGSESIDSGHWVKLAECVEKLVNDKDLQGVIITHGTDFLSYSSSALSFFLGKLNKPVVFTYSQRSIDRASSDASLNLQCAARMAISEPAEVLVVGHATINDEYCYAHRGVKVRKMHSSRRDAFTSINSTPVAKVWPDRVEFLDSFHPRNNKQVELDNYFSDKVALVKFYPGQDSSILDFYALKYKGVVFEASGLGHLPVSEARHNWLPKLKKVIREGLVVCVTTQTINGRVDPYVYSNGRELLEAGVIFLEDMLGEVAFVKLGWVLGHPGWKTKVKEKMLENFAGEFSKNLKYL